MELTNTHVRIAVSPYDRMGEFWRRMGELEKALSSFKTWVGPLAINWVGSKHAVEPVFYEHWYKGDQQPHKAVNEDFPETEDDLFKETGYQLNLIRRQGEPSDRFEDRMLQLRSLLSRLEETHEVDITERQNVDPNIPSIVTSLVVDIRLKKFYDNYSFE